ncbi:MAG: bifunctional diaminohydroxyphosphoribosylaminopyrimidine deaminase/5-amino-6-(5-phosphoribosylamino)uracil reductase RibD [Pseudomonadota bacterium]
MSDTDRPYMQHALALGARGLGQVAPWPSVGCVLVKDGRVVGRGRSDRVTHRHAERMALDQAGETARGATAYVTLEPCSHQGSTPPCADALIEAGIIRVVAALEDPNPLVAGQGLARLRAAGVAVEVGLCADQARAQHAGFLRVVQGGRPYLTLKLAASLDGRIATATGESQWITGPAARRLVHLMRARHDGVLVGGGTARADDPSLTVRGLGMTHQPVRVVWSRHLDVPLDGALARSAGEVPVWLCHGEDADAGAVAAWQARGARLFALPIGPSRHVEPDAALRALGQAGLTRIFCEGGGAMAASLMQAEMVDQLVIFTGGIALGAEGRPSLGALGLDRLADAPGFTLREMRPVGPDVMQVWSRADAQRFDD